HIGFRNNAKRLRVGCYIAEELDVLLRESQRCSAIPHQRLVPPAANHAKTDSLSFVLEVRDRIDRFEKTANNLQISHVNDIRRDTRRRRRMRRTVESG